MVGVSLDLMERTDGYFSPFWRRLPYGDAGPDPTGLVKGWAAQQASDVLARPHGLPDHVVNAAGDVVVSGGQPRTTRGRRGASGSATPSGPAPWPGPSTSDASLAALGRGHLGRRRSSGPHVRDPHTGIFPYSVVSATVVTRLDIHEDGGAVADAWATALVAAGEQRRSAARDARGGPDGRLPHRQRTAP